MLQGGQDLGGKQYLDQYLWIYRDITLYVLMNLHIPLSHLYMFCRPYGYILQSGYTEDIHLEKYKIVILCFYKHVLTSIETMYV